jgi:Cys-tRNA synthase (O-phospho-L-seryl-tRNA:Cys-tRNA synthase)
MGSGWRHGIRKSIVSPSKKLERVEVEKLRETWKRSSIVALPVSLPPVGRDIHQWEEGGK